MLGNKNTHTHRHMHTPVKVLFSVLISKIDLCSAKLIRVFMEGRKLLPIFLNREIGKRLQIEPIASGP